MSAQLLDIHESFTELDESLSGGWDRDYVAGLAVGLGGAGQRLPFTGLGVVPCIANIVANGEVLP